MTNIQFIYKRQAPHFSFGESLEDNLRDTLSDKLLKSSGETASDFHDRETKHFARVNQIFQMIR